jgi:hypothetical protein
MLTTHPLLVPRLRKSSAIPPLTLWVFLGLLRGSPIDHSYFRGKHSGYKVNEFLRTQFGLTADEVVEN